MHNEESILGRIHRIRESYDVEWCSREVAECAISELIWTVTNEEMEGGNFLDGIYEGVHPDLRTKPLMRKPFQK